MLKTTRRNLMIGAASVALAVAWQGGATAADVNLSLMIWDPAQLAGVQQAVDAFQAANPTIKVSVEQVPRDQFNTKVDASYAAGGGPDVMWQSSRASVYVEGGALQSLDEYIQRDGISLDGYKPEITALYNFGGQQYGMPKDFDAWTVVYNAAVLEELGVEMPAADWTWEDMVRIAEAVKAKQPGGEVIPLHYDFSFNNGVASLIHSLGGTVIKDGQSAMSSPEGIKALEMVKDLQDRGLIIKVADASDFNAVNALISGKVAMAEIPSWNLSTLAKADVPEGTFHVVPLPSVNGASANDTNGLSYVMNINSPHKEEAWKLIQFLTSDEGAVLHAEGGAGLPANNAEAPRAAFVQANAKLVGLEAALAVANEQSYLRTTTAHPKILTGLPEINSAVMGEFYSGAVSATDTAKRIDDILNEALR